jgi:histidinol-phosphatase (PHP family)
MPCFSYHGGHSGEFCRHARGELAAVVARAAAAGFTTYGLSEHCPRSRAEDLFPDESDLAPADLDRLFAAYLAEATRLAGEWADRLEVLVGFETEAVPPASWAGDMRSLRASLPRCDYVIGSVHHVGGVCIDLSAERTREAAEACGGRQALEIAYFDLVAEVAEALRPEVIGHIDLIRKFDGPDPRFAPPVWRAIDRALEAARAAGSALDVNAAPARRSMGPVYPLVGILERARVIGVPVTLGDDSHGPDDVGVGLDACMTAIAAAGYREVHHLTREGGVVTLVAAPIESVAPAAG